YHTHRYRNYYIDAENASLYSHFIHVISTQYLTLFFFFNDPATTELYTLSLHDALPIWLPDGRLRRVPLSQPTIAQVDRSGRGRSDRKSTRLNSSHVAISYAVFCLKKKNKLTSDLLNQSKKPKPATITSRYRKMLGMQDK